MQNTKEHWDNLYNTSTEDQLSWFQPHPETSIEFVDLFNLPLSCNIIDVGGGDSRFADALLDKGYQNIWVLDISGNSIERAKQRLGEKGSKVHWIVSDITKFEPPVKFDLWHDRATFHFLISRRRIDKYISVAEHSIKKNGYLVLGTFSENGPGVCSGLKVKRYSEASMGAAFEAAFERIKCVVEDHATPFNTIQNFLFCSFKKK